MCDVWCMCVMCVVRVCGVWCVCVMCVVHVCGVWCMCVVRVVCACDGMCVVCMMHACERGVCMWRTAVLCCVCVCLPHACVLHACFSRVPVCMKGRVACPTYCGSDPVLSPPISSNRRRLFRPRTPGRAADDPAADKAHPPAGTGPAAAGR